MGTVLIDIDKLLEATSNLTSEKNKHIVKKVEIDLLLENTRDWQNSIIVRDYSQNASI